MTIEIDQRLLLNAAKWFEGPLSTVLIKNEQHYPWIVLVPRREKITELMELSVADQSLLFQEITQVSEALKSLFKPDKINVGSLGNQVSQLHIHIIGRYQTDPLWPQGIWQGAYQASPYSRDEFEELVAKFKKVIRK